MPEKNRVVAGGMPVMIGTRKVAPNMATTCCIPIPTVRGQVSRSSGLTTSPGRTDLPLPWSFHLVPSMLMPGAFQRMWGGREGIFPSNFTAQHFPAVPSGRRAACGAAVPDVTGRSGKQAPSVEVATMDSRRRRPPKSAPAQRKGCP